MQIHLHTFCWNEAKMLPWFFRHYDDIVDHYFIWDNGSTDETQEILRLHPKVTLNHFVVQSESAIEDCLQLSNEFWKNSRDQADWVIVCDIDEHLYHPHFRDYLKKCKNEGITIMQSIGYQMVDEHFPEQNGQRLCDLIKIGVPDPTYMNKICIFNPTEIEEIHYSPGRHHASPVGNLVFPHKTEVKLLHYKYLGLEYLLKRYVELSHKLKKDDISKNYGHHYLWQKEEIEKSFNQVKSKAVNVFKHNYFQKFLNLFKRAIK